MPASTDVEVTLLALVRCYVHKCWINNTIWCAVRDRTDHLLDFFLLTRSLSLLHIYIYIYMLSECPKGQMLNLFTTKVTVDSFQWIEFHLCTLWKSSFIYPALYVSLSGLDDGLSKQAYRVTCTMLFLYYFHMIFFFFTNQGWWCIFSWCETNVMKYS